MLDFSWGNILHSNLINFLIMVAMFAVIIKKLNVGQKIEDMRASIEQKVKESDAIKREAKKDLKKVSESLANVDEEVKSIVKKGKDTAKAFEKKSKLELEKTVEVMKTNVEKQVDSEQKQVQSQLLKTVCASSIEIAQKQIKVALENDKNLHRKYIEEFIDSLETLEV